MASLLEDRGATRIAIVEVLLDAKLETHTEASINGYVIGRGGAHSIAIYERNGVSWVAEFRGDDHGELMNANTWFYFHAERLGYWHQGQGYRSAKPLPPQMLEEIERLHREKDARERATATQRCKVTLEEAAARLQRALETVDKAHDRRDPREQVMPPRAGATVQRSNSLMSVIRGFLSKTSRTPGQFLFGSPAHRARRL